jgi:hypothetical protein
MCPTTGIPDESATALTEDAAFPKRLGKPEEYAKLALAIVDNPMLNGQCLRLEAGQRLHPSKVTRARKPALGEGFRTDIT